MLPGYSVCNFRHDTRAERERKVLAHSRLYSVRGSENSRRQRIVVGNVELRRSSYMDIRDKSSDMARVGILKCGALFRSASASSVSRVMLEDTKRRRGEMRRRGDRRGARNRDCANGSNRICH